MTQSLLRPASESFADRLNRVVAAALETDLRFVASVASNGRRANVRASAVPNRRSDGFPLVRRSDIPGAPAMFLLPRFFVEISPETARLRVATSTIGLWVDITGGRKPPRPLIRVEYDRRLDTGHGRPRTFMFTHTRLNWPGFTAPAVWLLPIFMLCTSLLVVGGSDRHSRTSCSSWTGRTFSPISRKGGRPPCCDHFESGRNSKRRRLYADTRMWQLMPFAIWAMAFPGTGSEGGYAH